MLKFVQHVIHSTQDSRKQLRPEVVLTSLTRNTEFSNKRIQQAGIVKSQPILCIRRIKKDITEYEIFEYWWSGCHRRRDDEE